MVRWAAPERLAEQGVEPALTLTSLRTRWRIRAEQGGALSPPVPPGSRFEIAHREQRSLQDIRRAAYGICATWHMTVSRTTVILSVQVILKWWASPPFEGSANRSEEMVSWSGDIFSRGVGRGFSVRSSNDR